MPTFPPPLASTQLDVHNVMSPAAAEVCLVSWLKHLQAAAYRVDRSERRKLQGPARILTGWGKHSAVKAGRWVYVGPAACAHPYTLSSLARDLLFRPFLPLVTDAL